MLDLVQLQAFREVAERGTVSEAARVLGYTGPAISLQIAKLERELEGPVFDRVAGRLRLNAKGRALVPLAHEMLDLADRTKVRVATTSDVAHIVVAGFASAIRALVIPMLQSTPAREGSTVEVRESEDEDALRDLGLGHNDIAIVQEYDGLPTARNKRFTYTTLVRDRLRLVAPKGYRESVTLHDLATTGWLTNGAGTRCEAATSAILAKAGIEPTITGHAADNHTLLALVRARHGATIVPELVLAEGPRGLTISTQDLRVKRTILAVTRRTTTKQLEPVLRELIRIAKAAVPAADDGG